jgi:hypothetical protein
LVSKDLTSWSFFVFFHGHAFPMASLRGLVGVLEGMFGWERQRQAQCLLVSMACCLKKVQDAAIVNIGVGLQTCVALLTSKKAKLSLMVAQNASIVRKYWCAYNR